MMKFLPSVLLCAALSVPTLSQAGAIGFRETTLPDPGGDRPLRVAIWYPTEATGPVIVLGENKVFHGLPGIRDARPTAGAHPLVVLSHGYGGSWRNLGWLAADLVGQGYVVAAPDHPGTTVFDKSPDQAAKLRERPRDLSRVITALTAEPSPAGPIEPGRVAAVGHSLGGWTVMALGGARFSTEQFARDCARDPGQVPCGLSAELGLAADRTSPLNGDARDPRVGAVVALDLGGARGFTAESLASFPVPALVLAAGVDIVKLPAWRESGYLAANLPRASSAYVEIPDAAHFSFMQLCKPGAAALIEAETPGDGIVCSDGDTRDGGARDRAAIHQELAGRITAFLAAAIPSAGARR